MVYEGRLVQGPEGPISLDPERPSPYSLLGLGAEASSLRPGQRVRVEGTFVRVTAYVQDGIQVERVDQVE